MITKNKVVTFSFEMKDGAGNIIDKTQTPSTYLHGYGHIMPLLEQALEDKNSGDKLAVVIPPEKAFGRIDKHLIRRFSKAQFPQANQLQVGMKVYSPENKALIMRVINIENDEITVDANHPLAGQNITFDIEILAVRDATEEEINKQQVNG